MPSGFAIRLSDLGSMVLGCGRLVVGAITVRKFRPYFVVFSLSLILGGCAIQGAPLGWGGTHQVVQENSSSVTYMYDRLVGGYQATMNAASIHCEGYGKNPVPTNQGRNGMFNTITFECR